MTEEGHQSVSSPRLPREIEHLLWVEVQVGTIDLVETPENVLDGSLRVVAAGIVGKIMAERRAREFLSEEIDFVEEKDDAGSQEPSGIDNRIEEYQALHHSVLSQSAPL